MPHGRSEVPMPGRAHELLPDALGPRLGALLAALIAGAEVAAWAERRAARKLPRKTLYSAFGSSPTPTLRLIGSLTRLPERPNQGAHRSLV